MLFLEIKLVQAKVTFDSNGMRNWPERLLLFRIIKPIFSWLHLYKGKKFWRVWSPYIDVLFCIWLWMWRCYPPVTRLAFWQLTFASHPIHTVVLNLWFPYSGLGYFHMTNALVLFRNCELFSTGRRPVRSWGAKSVAKWRLLGGLYRYACLTGSFIALQQLLSLKWVHLKVD